MNIQLDIKRFGMLALACIVLAAIIVTGLYFGAPKILSFLIASSVFAVQVIIIIAIALMAVYISQAVRNMEWFDRNGAGTEMSAIRKRTDTTEERTGDALAVAVQYAASTILLAIILLSFFLMHSKGAS